MKNVYGFTAQGAMVSIYSADCAYAKVIGGTYANACHIAHDIGGNGMEHFSSYYNSLGEQSVWWVFSPHRTKGFSVRTERPEWQ